MIVSLSLSLSLFLSLGEIDKVWRYEDERFVVKDLYGYKNIEGILTMRNEFFSKKFVLSLIYSILNKNKYLQ